MEKPDGVRKHLFPQIFEAWKVFIKDGDWDVVEQARVACRDENLVLAGKIREIASKISIEPNAKIERLFQDQVVSLLGLAQ